MKIWAWFCNSPKKCSLGCDFSYIVTSHIFRSLSGESPVNFGRSAGILPVWLTQGCSKIYLLLISTSTHITQLQHHAATHPHCAGGANRTPHVETTWQYQIAKRFIGCQVAVIVDRTNHYANQGHQYKESSGCTCFRFSNVRDETVIFEFGVPRWLCQHWKVRNDNQTKLSFGMKLDPWKRYLKCRRQECTEIIWHFFGSYVFNLLYQTGVMLA